MEEDSADLILEGGPFPGDDTTRERRVKNSKRHVRLMAQPRAVIYFAG